jgi:hypothetical protein
MLSSGSIEEEIHFQPMPKRKRDQIWFRAQAIERQTHCPGRHGGVRGPHRHADAAELLFGYSSYWRLVHASNRR